MNVIEWDIDNFSCWNGYVHEKQIECPGLEFAFCPRILLFPRGPCGSKDQLVVHIYVLPRKGNESLSGQLTFIDSNGSLLSTQDIDEKKKKSDYYELIPELKFDEVAAQIRENDKLKKDRLTLRVNLKCESDMAFHLNTTIDVFDSTVKINPNTKNRDFKHDKHISTIQYSFADCEKGFMYLLVLMEKSTFSIQPTSFETNILVFTYLSVLDFDSVTRTEKNEHLFKDGKKWTLLNSLKVSEMSKIGFSLLFRVKIIPRNKYKHRCGFYTCNSKVIYVSPTNIPPFHSPSIPKELSTKSLDAGISDQSENPVTVLLKELMCLYQDHDFSDFQLRCGESVIPTHKNILSARSPVFKALLSSAMTEAASDSMDIPDLDVHTLGRFLVFLYTGTVEDLQWEVALKLYYAADKYQVPTLKTECVSVLRKHVSICNVCDVLSLADKHQDHALTAEAHGFILKNYNDVLRSDGWKTFMSDEPLLAVKTVTNLAEKNVFRVARD